MAQVRLDRDEVRDLPAVCMRCGQPSEVVRGRTFAWQPPWIAILLLAGLLPYIIVALILTKRMRVDVPLCAAHKNHWLSRNLLVWGSLLGLGALALVALLLSEPLADQMGLQRDDAFGFACVGAVVLAVVWIIIAVVAQQTAMRPTEITNDTITLTGVSQDFRRAVKEMEREEDEEDEEDYPPRRPNRPRNVRESPPRRPLPPDAYREAEE